jgi:NAD(P)H-dependent FMN reductase
MEHKDFPILGLAGSLRRASFHRGIVRAAHEVAPKWMSCESFDLARIPYLQTHPPVREAAKLRRGD